ncbi:MAG: SusC/RagA family TonB-linked outer membrane protein [Bacteroidetes bacterium]|nr:SusC/RagA family TonB-linked outer membrane protein [Bacteroidota bacterium]
MSRILYISACLIVLFTGTITLPCSAQDPIRINGMVMDERGEALGGISISLEGVLADPVISDSSGKFTLSAPTAQQWLIISPAELYKTKRVYLNGRETIRILMTPSDLASGDDLVQNIFNEEHKRDLLSSAQSIQTGSLHRVTAQTIDESFQGNIAGAYSIHHSGMPGSGVVNYLRGIKSMNTNNQPLYVIDGLPLESPGIFNPLTDGYSYNPLTSLDPNDITSMTVLKDFAAGSAFGMRGSNGVVMIETLKPTEVRTIIDFSLRTGVSSSPGQIPQLNALQYKSLAHEVLNTSGQWEENLPGMYPGLYTDPSDPNYLRYGNNTNWQNEVFSNNLFSDFYLRIMGGDQIARYGLSVGYLNHNGIVNNTSYNRFNVRFVGTFTLFKWLRLYVSSNLTRTDSKLKESTRSEQTSPILTALHKTPLMFPFDFDDEGQQLISYSDVDELGVSNPAVTINGFSARNKNYRFLTSIRLEGDVTENLKWKSLFGINVNAIDELIFMPNHGMELYYNIETFNAAKSLKDYLFSIYNDNNLTYNKEIGNQHKIIATAGFRLNTNSFEEDWGIAKNSNKNDEYRSLTSGTSYLRELGGQSTKWNRLGIYSRINYIFRDRYMAHAGLVSETSTRIGRNAYQLQGSDDLIMLGDVPFGLFYSAGAAWRISNESFLKNYSWLEDLKLRLTWGRAGNDDIGNENALRFYQIKLYRESSGMVPGNLSDRTIRFETGTQLNPGVDLSLFANRVSLSFDYYSGRTDNLLVYEPQFYYAGYKTVANNNGSLSNKGWEFAAFTRIITRGKFHWDLGLNLSGSENEIMEISNDEIITDFHGGAFLSRKGEALLNFYGYQYDGVFSSQQDAEDANIRNERGIVFGAGDARFLDLSGPGGEPDGIIDNYDKTMIGSPLPDLYGSASTSFTYGIWSLSGSIQFVSGNDVYNYVRSQNEKMSDLTNQSTNVLQRWQYDGHETDIPRASWDDPTGNAEFSSRWIEDGSYLRLKHLTLSCRIPDKFLFFRDAEFYITGTNLITISNYLGYDPEFAVSYHTMEQGIDYGLMPLTRKLMVGIKLGL